MRSSPLYSLLGIAGRPVDDVERRIVAAGEPGRRAAVLDVLALPGLRSRLARLRHGPEAPDLLAGLLIVRGDEAVGAVLAARDAGDDQVAGGQRRRRGRVVLAPVVELGVPQQLAGEAIERDDVRVVGHHEDAIAGDRRAAVRAAAAHALRARPLVVPDPPPAAGVERVALVRRGHVHDAVDDDRRALQPAGVGNGEHPSRRQPRHVVLVDLASASCSGCRRARRCRSASPSPTSPRDTRRRRGAAGARACRPSAAADRRSPRRGPGPRASGRRSSRSARGRSARLAAPLDRAQEFDEIGDLGLGDAASAACPWPGCLRGSS